MSGENDWGTVPSYTCPDCGAVDELDVEPDGSVVCGACGWSE